MTTRRLVRRAGAGGGGCLTPKGQQGKAKDGNWSESQGKKHQTSLLELCKYFFGNNMNVEKHSNWSHGLPASRRP
jgi:hypothetical protein